MHDCDQARLKIMAAIAHRQLVTTRYNGGSMKLAPHILFERHGELFLSALNLGKAWRSEEEQRFGQFKLAGMNSIEILDEAFEPKPLFTPETPRPSDTLVLAV